MRIVCSAAVLVAACLAGPCLAAEFPQKAVRFVVPFPPGGGTDALARLLGAKLNEYWGQQVIIDNRAGAQGGIGTAVGAKATPDGYTILLAHSGALVINPHMYDNPGYDTLKDFAPLTRGTETPYILIVHPSVPVKTMKELAQLAKQRPGQLTFASTSAGPQLMGELFKLTTKTEMVHVPYKGAGPAVIDLLGGHVGIMFSVPTSVAPHIRSGKLRALAITTATRAPSLPDLPTVAEAGVPGYDSSSWNAIFVPAGTPRAIVERLNKEFDAILRSKETVDYFASQGAEPGGGTPEQLDTFVRNETAKWAKAVKDSGARVD
jgi:tripartite-type tricarboxylate transporter receptor subunit TctC